MKTIEEKAKAYDEALKDMRVIYPNLKGDAKLAVEHAFPELYESEDENLKNKSGYYKAGKFWKASTLWNAVKDKTPQRVPNRYILQECTWNIGTLQRFADEIKNVQEVSLDYPIILDMNGNILDGAHRVVKAYLEGKDIDIVYLGDDEWPEPDYDEEKAVKESEDERIRKWLVDYFSSIKATVWIHRDITCEQILEWLEKQKEQTPEWSEEDEKIVKFYEDDCNHRIGNMPMKDVIEMRLKFKDWIANRIKFLRPQPHWKPSEEQMKALDKAIPVCAGIAGKDEMSPLISLYEELKKLENYIPVVYK